MKKKIVIKLGDITKRVINEHQLLKKEQNRIRSLNEQIEYDERHPERMNPSIEDSLRQGRHTFGKSKGLPVTGNDQNYSEKLASARFKDIIRMIFNKRRKKLKNCITKEMKLNMVMQELSYH